MIYVVVIDKSDLQVVPLLALFWSNEAHNHAHCHSDTLLAAEFIILLRTCLVCRLQHQTPVRSPRTQETSCLAVFSFVLL